MPVFNHYPLQKTIYQTLTGNGTLMALINGVFDRPPQGTPMPYITIGESHSQDWSSKTTSGVEHLLTIHVWSREGGRKEAALIMESIHTLLHQANLTVEGHSLVLIRYISSDITLENDGYTYHGNIRFRALLEASI